MSARILVAQPLPEPALAVLREAGMTLDVSERPLPPAEPRKAAADADAVLCTVGDRIDAEFFAAVSEKLRCVCNVAVGYDNIDLHAAAAAGVVITNTPGVLTDATADITIALLLAVARRLGEGERLVRSQAAWSWGMNFMLRRDLAGKTLGIVGLGAIGHAVATRARAFGLSIVYSGRRRADRAVERALDARYLELDGLLTTSDFVSLHCPLNPDTRHLIDARRLPLLRETAYLINTARGPVVDEDALVHALRSGALAGAGLDVFENEPEVHPGLLERDDVILIPHLGSATVETREAMALLAARNALAVLGGEPPLTPVR